MNLWLTVYTNSFQFDCDECFVRLIYFTSIVGHVFIPLDDWFLTNTPAGRLLINCLVSTRDQPVLSDEDKDFWSKEQLMLADGVRNHAYLAIFWVQVRPANHYADWFYTISEGTFMVEILNTGTF